MLIQSELIGVFRGCWLAVRATKVKGGGAVRGEAGARLKKGSTVSAFKGVDKDGRAYGYWVGIWVKRVSAGGDFGEIRKAVIVIVKISVIANAIWVSVFPFTRVIGKWVLIISYPIAVRICWTGSF